MSRIPLPPAESIQLSSLAELASGGMGTIELARAQGGKHDGQLFAVKRLHERYAKDPQFVAMFLDEVWMTAALSSPNVVHLAAWGTDDRGMFLAAEPVIGVSLHGLFRSALQRKEAFSERTVAFICSEICSGLAAAHDLRDPEGTPLGLVHRDLSVGNVLVSFKGDVKIADFGIAKSRARITQTETGMLKGKPGYMAPEQARGQDVDHRADIFSFGVLMFELLAGRRPWIADSPIELMLEAAQDPPPDLLSIRKGCDPRLATIINKCLEKDPKDRYPSAMAIKALIDEWRADKGFVGGERDSLARFVLKNCELQAEWFKRALNGDFLRGTITSFKELEEQMGAELSAKGHARRSRPGTPIPSEPDRASGRETPTGAEGGPSKEARPSGSGARFSFVARWAQQVKDEESGAGATAMPRPMIPPKDEPTPVPGHAQPSPVPRAAPKTAVTPVAAPAPRPAPAAEAAPAAASTAASTAAPAPAPPIRNPPQTSGKLKAPQETLKSNEVIPDLMRAIGSSQAPSPRPAHRPPPTVKVTAATVEEATKGTPSDSSDLSSNSNTVEASTTTAGDAPKPAKDTPREPSNPAKPSPSKPATGAPGEPSKPVTGASGASGASREPSKPVTGASGASREPSKPATGASRTPSKPAVGAARTPSKPAIAAQNDTSKPATPAPAQAASAQAASTSDAKAAAPSASASKSAPSASKSRRGAAKDAEALNAAAEPVSDLHTISTPRPAAPPPVPEETAAPPPDEPAKPASPLLPAAIAAAQGMKNTPVSITALNAPDEEIDPGPQPTMKSPLVAPNVAPAPQPPIDVQVSLPAPLPPAPPAPAVPKSDPRGGKRRTEAGRTRISTPLAKSPAAAAAAKATKRSEQRSAAIIAVIALLAGAIIAWVVRNFI